MPKILIDEKAFDKQTICRHSIIEELGTPLKTGELDFDNEVEVITWIEKDYNLVQWGYDEIRYEYKNVFQYCTSWEINDINGGFEFTIYYQSSASDAFWARDSYVKLGDRLYFLCGGGIADTDFFQWRIGWFLMPIHESEDERLDSINEKLSPGYTISANYDLEKMLYRNSVPTWSKKLNCFVAKIKDYSHPVRMNPTLF
jgi:hypothetical protein